MKLSFLLASSLLVPCAAWAGPVPAPPVTTTVAAPVSATKATFAADQLLLDKTNYAIQILSEFSVVQSSEQGTTPVSLLQAKMCLEKAQTLLTVPASSSIRGKPRPDLLSNSITGSWFNMAGLWVQIARNAAPKGLKISFGKPLQAIEDAGQQVGPKLAPPHPAAETTTGP